MKKELLAAALSAALLSSCSAQKSSRTDEIAATSASETADTGLYHLPWPSSCWWRWLFLLLRSGKIPQLWSAGFLCHCRCPSRSCKSLSGIFKGQDCGRREMEPCGRRQLLLSNGGCRTARLRIWLCGAVCWGRSLLKKHKPVSETLWHRFFTLCNRFRYWLFLRNIV